MRGNSPRTRHVETPCMPAATPWYLAPIKYIFVGAREFYEAEGFSRASSLAYTTLLSLIPLSVVILSVWGSVKDEALAGQDLIDNAFGRVLWTEDEPHLLVRVAVPERIPEEVIEEIFGEREVLELRTSELETLLERIDPTALDIEERLTSRKQLIQKLEELINNLRRDLKTIGFLGALFLFITTISLFNSIESNLNELWHVRARRNPVRKFLVLWAMVTLGPILIAASFAIRAKYLSSFIEPHFEAFVLPYVFTWLAFFLLYRFVPHTRVSFSSAAAAALVTGALWEAIKVVFSYYVFAIQKSESYTNITYGSLALIPIFLFWLYVSWLVALLGVKLCYVWQHLGSYTAPGWRTLPPTTEAQELLAARVVARIVERQYRRERSPTLATLVHDLRAPQHRVEIAVDALRRAGLITEHADEEGLISVVPPDQLSLETVTEAVRGTTSRQLPAGQSEEPEIARLLAAVDEARGRILGSAFYSDLVGGEIASTGSPTKEDVGHPERVAPPAPRRDENVASPSP